MLYAAVRPLATIGLRYYFRRIDLAQLERIPQDAAVILAANHPTTFIEPCILACFQNRPLQFLARGDFFRSPFFARLLRGVHITPVYRLRDGGYGGIKNNYESFEKAHQILAEKKCLMILAEGRCIHEKRLRPIRKGTARIALGALKEKDLNEVYIVPIGVNFTYADRLRSQVMLRCGEPIRASTYLADFQQNEPQAIKRFTDDLRDKLAEQVVIIDEQADEPLLEHILQLFRTEHFELLQKNGVIYGQEKQLLGEKKIADKLNALPLADKQTLAAQTHDYFSRLSHMRITDQALMGKWKRAQGATSFVLLGAIPACLLLCLHIPIWALVQWLSGTKIKSIEFASPVRWSGTVFMYLLYAILFLVLSFAHSWWWLLFGTFTFMSLPWLIRYGEVAHQWLLAWRVKRQPTHELDYIKPLRQRILQQVSVFWDSPA